jgi:hypothetical protein
MGAFGEIAVILSEMWLPQEDGEDDRRPETATTLGLWGNPIRPCNRPCTVRKSHGRQLATLGAIQEVRDSLTDS